MRKKLILRRIKNRVAKTVFIMKKKARPVWFRSLYLLNEILLFVSVRIKYLLHGYYYPDSKDEIKGNEYSILRLHKDIRKILKKQRREYKNYIYEYGIPYQRFDKLQILGARPTETRFEEYGLRELIKKNTSVLDIGCNCGFLTAYISYMTGCEITGIDINPYLVEVGALTAKYMNLDNRVLFNSLDLKEFKTDKKFNTVLSFASYWTDDGLLRMKIEDHIMLIHKLLKPNGYLVLESHANDTGDPEFRKKIESLSDYYKLRENKLLEYETRELFVLQKHSVDK